MPPSEQETKGHFPPPLDPPIPLTTVENSQQPTSHSPAPQQTPQTPSNAMQIIVGSPQNFRHRNVTQRNSHGTGNTRWWKKLTFWEQHGHPADWLNGGYHLGSLPGHENSCTEIRTWMEILCRHRSNSASRDVPQREHIANSTWDGNEFWRNIQERNVRRAWREFGLHDDDIDLLLLEIKASLSTSQIAIYSVLNRQSSNLRYIDRAIAVAGFIAFHELRSMKGLLIADIPLLILGVYFLMLCCVVISLRFYDKALKERGEKIFNNEAEEETLAPRGGASWWWRMWAGYDPFHPQELN